MKKSYLPQVKPYVERMRECVNESDGSDPGRPAADGAIPLDVKRSSHKRLSKLLQAKAQRGWLTAKEDKHTKEMMLTSVNRKHADVTSHRSHETAAAAESAAAAAAAEEAAAVPDFYRGRAVRAEIGFDPQR